MPIKTQALYHRAIGAALSGSVDHTAPPDVAGKRLGRHPIFAADGRLSAKGIALALSADEPNAEIAGNLRAISVAIHGKSKSPAAECSAFLLSADALAPFEPSGPASYQEIPTDEEIGKNADGSPVFQTRRVPVAHFRKEIVRAGTWALRGGGTHALTGEPVKFDITIPGIDQMVSNFRELKSAGVLPWVPDHHDFGKPSNASNQNGFVTDLQRQGDSLYGTFKLVGEAAIEKAMKNDVSVGMLDGQSDGVIDAFGKKYSGTVLHHVTMTPNPNQPHLSPFERIAASADRPAMNIPIFQLSCDPLLPNPLLPGAKMAKGQELSEGHLARVHAVMGKMGKDPTKATMDNGVDHACDCAEGASGMGLSADQMAQAVKLIGGARATNPTAADILAKAVALSADLAAKSTEILALSADKKVEPDALSMTLITRAFKTDREQVIASGVISEAGMKELDGLLMSSGKPTHQALALSAGSVDPFYSRLCEILRKNPGIKTDTAANRAVGQPLPASLSADPNRKEKTADEIKQFSDAVKKAGMVVREAE